MRFLMILAGLLLAACNLQAVPPTPTAATMEPPAPLTTATDLPTRTPAVDAAATPTLQPTPTQQVFTSVTADAPPTVLNAGSPVPGGPTLDAAQADGVSDVTISGSVDLIYTVEVTRGTLTFTVQGGPGIIWQQVFTATEDSRATITAPQDGVYQLLINTENFDGSYSFRWE